jgi:hypothetical protein
VQSGDIAWDVMKVIAADVMRRTRIIIISSANETNTTQNDMSKRNDDETDMQKV